MQLFTKHSSILFSIASRRVSVFWWYASAPYLDSLFCCCSVYSNCVFCHFSTSSMRTFWSLSASSKSAFCSPDLPLKLTFIISPSLHFLPWCVSTSSDSYWFSLRLLSTSAWSFIMAWKAFSIDIPFVSTFSSDW